MADLSQRTEFHFTGWCGNVDLCKEGQMTNFNLN